METARKLQVGDKVVNISNAKWCKDVFYNFDTVERLTNTMAVLKSGVKLINEPKSKIFGAGFEYSKHGDKWTRYEISTPKVEKDAEEEEHRRKAQYWFANKKFTDVEIKIIYELLKDKPKDENV